MTSTMASRRNWPKITNYKEAWSNQKAPDLGDFVVSPGFAYNISRFYPSASELKDKETCLKLMQKLGLPSDPISWYRPVRSSKTYSPRPPSAPATTIRKKMESYSQNPDLFYTTTHKKDFEGDHGSPADKTRPKSAKMFPNRGAILDTTYQYEFCPKRTSKCSPIRAGTATGARRNNPHPTEGFLVWRFPSKLPPEVIDDSKSMEDVCYDQLKSTYQNDFTGIPQGVQIQTVFDGDVSVNIPKPPYTLDSTTRHTYQKPDVRAELKCNLSRYGCNKNKYKPTVGAVPSVTATSPLMHVSGRTQYTDEYYKKALTQLYPGDTIRIKSGPIPALEEFLKYAKPQEKDALIKELTKIAKNDNRETKNPDRFTKYTGPS
uniref:Uncharacterized protein LOC116297566 n=1 Tax=Actinia tenebrosa TaxID=6105 RepID=A0A6P8I992_ACTTE